MTPGKEPCVQTYLNRMVVSHAPEGEHGGVAEHKIFPYLPRHELSWGSTSGDSSIQTLPGHEASWGPLVDSSIQRLAVRGAGAPIG